jgi:hypothetical protein
MRELSEAYNQFPKWFQAKCWKYITIQSVFDFSDSYSENRFVFQFKLLHTYTMRRILTFEEFLHVYETTGRQNIELTYLHLSEMIKKQFIDDVLRLFRTEVGDYNYE